jgi:PAS domain S-box-containing protein
MSIENEMFRRMFESHSASMLIVDKDNSGKIIDANSAAGEFYGYSVDTLKSMKISDINVMTTDEIDTQMQSAITTKTNYFNFRHRLANGQIRDVEVHSSPIILQNKTLLFSIIHDVTYKKELEKKLLETNENLKVQVEREVQNKLLLQIRYSAIFDQTGEAMFLHSFDANFNPTKFIEVNKSAARLTGYSKDELKNLTPYSIFKDDFFSELEVMEWFSKEQVFYGETKLKTKNGVEKPILASSVTIEFGDEAIGLISVRDISELANIRQKQQQQERILMQQSKMAAMGEMIGAIAHQWRQPLNSLAITIQDVKAAFEYNEIDKAYINDFVKDSMLIIMRMSKTIDDFRNFFKPSKIKEPFSPAEALKDVLNIVLAQLKNNFIEVEVSIDNDQAMIEGYKNEFEQVLVNIISNAKDALLENKVKNPKIRISVYEDGDSIVVTIADNGGGIEDAVAQRIYEPYFTTKDQGKGTGIGLYMSSVIVQDNMNGKIYHRNIDNGVTFFIELRSFKENK